MEPGSADRTSPRRNDALTGPPNPSPANTMRSSFQPARARLRSEGPSHSDSWIDIASQPSTSSLSSIENEIVTTGLQLQQMSGQRQARRRRLHPDASGLRLQAGPISAAGSSQDEYDESESESDVALSSSNEDLVPTENDVGRLNIQSDDDDNSTALGPRNAGLGGVFTPQPNAFSHPPTQNVRNGSRSVSTPQSYFPPVSATSLPVNTLSRPPLPATSRSQNSCTATGPPHTFQTDHDAVLRASLSTLLSCAAAVRGTPKQPAQVVSRPSPNPQPTKLRLVPESALFPSVNSPNQRPRSPKRKARESSKDRHTKKSRAGNARSSSVVGAETSTTVSEGAVSPALMGWVISAGVVLVFSAISFSLGYALGREVGRIEGQQASVGVVAGCGREAVRNGSGGGLRRGLRWGSASGITA